MLAVSGQYFKTITHLIIVTKGILIIYDKFQNQGKDFVGFINFFLGL